MVDPGEKYLEAFAAFSKPGGRWANVGKLAFWGRAAGLTADDVIAHAWAAGVTDRDADIRRGFGNARPKDETAQKGETAQRTCVPRERPKPQPPRFSAHVRNILAGTDADNGTPDWVRTLSPFDVRNLTPTEQTAAFVRAAFKPDELLFVFRSDKGTRGLPGVNLRAAADWLSQIDVMRVAGDLVKSNTFTGAPGHNKSGRRSYVSQDCLAAFPHALLEFDAMPLPMQCAFWRGFIQSEKLASVLVSLTFSGGKSIHGLLHVGCRTLPEWQAVRRRLIDLFAADADERFRVDTQALHPLIGTRLPGVTRRGRRVVQELLYLNPRARKVGP